MSQLKVMKVAAAGGDMDIGKEKQGRGARPTQAQLGAPLMCEIIWPAHLDHPDLSVLIKIFENKEYEDLARKLILK